MLSIARQWAVSGGEGIEGGMKNECLAQGRKKKERKSKLVVKLKMWNGQAWEKQYQKLGNKCCR